MNKGVAGVFRAELKARLEECTPGQREVFVRMYGPREHLRDKFLYNVAAIAKNNIDMVVDKMPEDKLDWALQQITRTLNKK